MYQCHLNLAPERKRKENTSNEHTPSINNKEEFSFRWGDGCGEL